FETIGLGNMKLEVIVSTEIEEIENFKKKTIEEDRKIAQKTYSDKEKREVSAKQNETNKQLEIGYKIPEEPSIMEENKEEEKKITYKKNYYDKVKRELSVKLNGTNKRLEIRYKIPEELIFMEEIMEEENKMTFQGYIFKVDVRTLRSKRSLLIIKATDYTDS